MQDFSAEMPIDNIKTGNRINPFADAGELFNFNAIFANLRTFDQSLFEQQDTLTFGDPFARKPEAVAEAENIRLNQSIQASPSVGEEKILEIGQNLSDLPQSTKQALLDQNVAIHLFSGPEEDNNPLKPDNAAAYVSDNNIVVYCGPPYDGYTKETLYHECFHIFEGTQRGPRLVTGDADFQRTAAAEINNLNPDQFNLISWQLTDGPAIATKFGQVRLGDLAAEEYAAAFGAAQRPVAYDIEMLCPQTTAMVREICLAKTTATPASDLSGPSAPGDAPGPAPADGAAATGDATGDGACGDGGAAGDGGGGD